MGTSFQELDLLSERDGIIRVPFLIKGQLIAPPQVSREKVEAAFSGAGADVAYAKLPNAQLIRERVIDRKTMRYTSEHVYQVMPAIQAIDLVETDIDTLVHGLYALRVEDVLHYLTTISAFLDQNWAWVDRVRDLCRRTSELPDAYLDGAFTAFRLGLDAAAAKSMIDNELSVWSKPGSAFLDGWVEMPAQVLPGLVMWLGQGLSAKTKAAPPSVRPCIRAMPTRQLHITAGNAPTVPVVSALRAILTHSAGVIKLPYGATLTGALFSLALATAAPDHPITRHLSIVYWTGGDESVESVFFAPGAFDRIVVWGAPEAISSVRSRALFTRTVCFSPRYGVSMIGREAFADDLEQVAVQASMDTMIYNQKACNASYVHYVEGPEEKAHEYAALLQRILCEWDALAPQFVRPSARGQIKRMRRGRFARAHWHTNVDGGAFASGVVVMPDEFDILDHPMCRLVVVRPVDDLDAALDYMHAGVSTVGVYPEGRRLALRDRILARGASNVIPLGQCERMFAGMPHDGMMVLSQLVDWKNA